MPLPRADALALPSLITARDDPVLRRPPTATLPKFALDARKRYYDEGEKNWGAGTERNYRHYLFRHQQPPVALDPTLER